MLLISSKHEFSKGKQIFSQFTKFEFFIQPNKSLRLYVGLSCKVYVHIYIYMYMIAMWGSITSGILHEKKTLQYERASNSRKIGKNFMCF